MEENKSQVAIVRKKLVLGIFGFGVVGQGLYDILQHNPSLDIRIKKFVIKHPSKSRTLPDSYFSTDPRSILDDPEITTVVELIDDADAAFDFVAMALRNGKDVVSANKKMIATHLKELLALQQQTRKSLLYEGAVCGSIPIIRNLEEYYDNELLLSVSGIFNGSSNFILSKLFNEGKSYAEALEEAQELGFAESNPILDVAGYDSKYKLLILTAHAYGLFLNPEELLNLGIQHVNEVDIAYANANTWKIKLKPQVSSLGDNKISAFVIPAFIAPNHLLYQVEKENNAVIVKAAFADEQLFYGKGAGGHPTGAAVLSDIAALRYSYKYEYKKYLADTKWKLQQDVEVKVYLRFSTPTFVQYVPFTYVHEQKQVLDNSGISHTIVLGTTTIINLHLAKKAIEEEGAFVAILP